MKKILFNIMIILFSVIPYNVYAISTNQAKEEINIKNNGSISLNYNYDDYIFDNTVVNIYYIAYFSNDYLYHLNPSYVKYPIKVNGIKNASEWNNLIETINSYIYADKINPDITSLIKNNKVYVSNLQPGLYYIETNKIEGEDSILKFNSTLVSIPDLNKDGTWNYDVSVNPKIQEYIPKYDNINYKVIKTWIDNEKERPEYVEIEIYKNRELIDSKVLSKDNNWLYEWNDIDDGSDWTVIERNIPKEYTVSIQKNNNTFIIVNTNSNYEELPPQTKDNIDIYFNLLVTSLICLVLIITSFFISKRR